MGAATGGAERPGPAQRPGLPPRGRQTRREQEYVEAVLSRVEAIPAGRVSTYGLLAEQAGAAVGGWGGPRQVGRVMAVYGGSVPWLRVVHADGTPPHCHDATALSCYREEGTPLRPSGKVDIRRALWVPSRRAPVGGG
ncbi:MAG: MGMT family protein [Nocardioidaceae bacterium]